MPSRSCAAAGCLPASDEGQSARQNVATDARGGVENATVK